MRLSVLALLAATALSTPALAQSAIGSSNAAPIPFGAASAPLSAAERAAIADEAAAKKRAQAQAAAKARKAREARAAAKAQEAEERIIESAPEPAPQPEPVAPSASPAMPSVVPDATTPITTTPDNVVPAAPEAPSATAPAEVIETPMPAPSSDAPATPLSALPSTDVAPVTTPAGTDAPLTPAAPSVEGSMDSIINAAPAVMGDEATTTTETTPSGAKVIKP